MHYNDLNLQTKFFVIRSTLFDTENQKVVGGSEVSCSNSETKPVEMTSTLFKCTSLLQKTNAVELSYIHRQISLGLD